MYFAFTNQKGFLEIVPDLTTIFLSYFYFPWGIHKLHSFDDFTCSLFRLSRILRDTRMRGFLPCLGSQSQTYFLIFME